MDFIGLAARALVQSQIAAERAGGEPLLGAIQFPVVAGAAELARQQKRDR